jgi:hypothetical protein
MLLQYSLNTSEPHGSCSTSYSTMVSYDINDVISCNTNMYIGNNKVHIVYD